MIMKLEVLDIQGKKTGRKVDLPKSIFAVEEPSEHAIYQDVRQMLANKRQGTAKTKERSEVSGSRKKPYRQKGTGNARAGSKQSPLWRHGGTVFGPKPRDYGFKLNKKLKNLARKSALTLKAKNKSISLVEGFSFEKPRTKDFVNILSALEMANNKVLLVIPEDDKNVVLSGRNLPNARITRASDLNTYDIMNAENLLIVEGAVQVIEDHFSKN